jgi:hypothetical protein
MGWFAQILFLDPKFLEPGNLMQIQPKTILPSPLQIEDTCTTYEPNKRPRLQPPMSAHESAWKHQTRRPILSQMPNLRQLN